MLISTTPNSQNQLAQRSDASYTIATRKLAGVHAHNTKTIINQGKTNHTADYQSDVASSMHGSGAAASASCSPPPSSTRTPGTCPPGSSTSRPAPAR